jgi:antitoxin PrlF
MVTKAALRERGQLTLPAAVREALHIDQGDDVEFTIEDGQVIMRGLHSVPADQKWFWTAEWQAREAQASAEIAAGQTTRAETMDELFAPQD